jgi:hypothetical protein
MRNPYHFRFDFQKAGIAGFSQAVNLLELQRFKVLGFYRGGGLCSAYICFDHRTQIGRIEWINWIKRV